MDKKKLPLWPDQLKKTRPRMAVWKELSGQPFPMTALAIFTQLREKDPHICLSTVYRILDAFTDAHTVIRSVAPDGAAACYGLNWQKHTHYAVCICCHRMLPVTICPFEQAAHPVGEENFHITGHHLELLGYCDACYKKKESSP